MDERHADMAGKHAWAELHSAIEWVGGQVPGGFFVYRASGSEELLYVNEATLKIFGCATKDEFTELTGGTFPGLVHPHDLARVHEEIEHQIQDPSSDHLDFVEYRIVRKDGEVRWVDDYGRLNEVAGIGQVFYVFISDVTEKHVVQEEMRRRQSVHEGMLGQFAGLADSSLTVLRTNMTTGVIEEIRGCDLFETDVAGGSAEAAFEARCKSIVSEADRERYVRLFDQDALKERFYRGLAPKTIVAFSRRASGRQCFVRYSASVVVDPVTQDVIGMGVETEYNAGRVHEVLNEKVLAQQYDMVCYLVGDSYGVVIGGEEETRHASLFPSARDGSYARYVEEQVLPMADASVHDKDELARQLSLETVAKHLETEPSYVVDLTCEVRGETLQKRFTYYLVDAEASFYVLLKVDVTDVVREERERVSLLAAALADAERAGAAKSSFLSRMSHEIRTPMNAIIGYDTIALADAGVPSSTRAYLEKIGEAAKHLLSLINDVLDMSRIEDGRMLLEDEGFSLTELLSDLETATRSRLAPDGPALTWSLADDIGERYVGDGAKLRQVLSGILDNAVKFTDSGSISFEARRSAAFEGRETLVFTISDTGRGMDADFVPHVFDAFSQEHPGASSRFGSTGLGLTIAKSIVDMMRGTIEVTSAVGVGTTVCVTVTLQVADAGSPASVALPEGLTALVADDEELDRTHAALVLKELGVAATTCAGADEALRLVRERGEGARPFDVVLCCQRVALADEFTRGIASLHASERPVVVMLTTFSADDVAAEASAAGVSGVITKPLFADAVRTVLIRALAHKGDGRATLEGRHVLVVEDIDLNAEIVQEVLELREVTSERAHDGAEGVAMFAGSPEGHFDAVLMDIRMPVMDGHEACRRIRALPRADATRVPIIALTANAFEEDVERSLQAGMDAHLSKPVDFDVLYDTLERLI